MTLHLTRTDQEESASRTEMASLDSVVNAEPPKWGFFSRQTRCSLSEWKVESDRGTEGWREGTRGKQGWSGTNRSAVA